MKRTANFFPIQPLTALVAAALVVLLAVPLALASRAQAVITEPIPADASPGPPPIPALPPAGETAPPAAAIADSITPEGTCGAWYRQSNYAARWPAASTWWEYQCTRSDSYYYTTCTGYCDAFCPSCYWESWEWTDYFYWDGSDAVFYGESYFYSSISDGEYWPPFTSSYWWDAPTSQWYLLTPDDVPANVQPTASFMAACSALTCSFDGSASSDGDGTIVYYFWDFGDNSSEGPLATTDHTYATPGTYTVTLTVADGQGGWDTTSHLVGVAVDPPPEVPPDTSIESGPSGLTNDSTPTFSFSSSEPGSTFECTVNSSGSSGGGGLMEDAFNFASVGSFAPCASPETLAPLPDGGYVFEVRAVDAATNTDPTPASRSFTVDTTAPGTQIDSGPSGLTNDSTPTFSFSSTEPGSAFECRLNNSGGGGGGGLAEEAFNSFNSASVGSFAPCTSPETLAALPDGGYVFEVRAIDAAANTEPTPASRSFTVDTTAVDTTAPGTQIDSGPTGPTNDSTPTFTFSSPGEGATFECRLDGDPFADCDSPLTADPLPDGLHSFEVRARDAAGSTDPSPAGASFTIDTAAPDTSIDSGPSGSTNDNTPIFAFSSEQGASFECRLDGDGYAACSSPLTTSPLSDGLHNLEVRATDAVANTDPSPASRSFVVDTTPPDTTIDSGPAAGSTTGDNTPTFTFSSEQGVSFQCRIDGSAFSSCIPPHYEDLGDEEPAVGTPSEGGSFTPLTPLTDGPHTFEVRARDAAANADPSPASRSFTVDATPPNTSIGSGPSGPTNDTTPSFSFSSGDQNASFACRVDDGAYSACNTPFTTDPLSDGPHSFEVRASDAVGNTDPSPASRSFTVDTTPPETSIDSGPTGPTNDPTPSFTFSSEQGASFECRVDGGVYSPCSSPFTTSPLTNGPHSFEVRARDSLANTDPSPASRSFVVDTTPPDTSIDSGPASRTNDTTPTFAFSSSEQGSTFACRLDGAAYVACSSPYTTSPLSSGHHSFEVRATDAAANTDPSAAGASFRIARGGPIGQRSTGTTSADTLPPDMKLSGSGKQTVGEPIEVEVSCPEDCAVVASGKVLVWGSEDRHAEARSSREKARFGLRRAQRQLIAGETATLKLMPKSARAGLELKRLVSSGHKAIAGISVNFTDRAGNSRAARLTIRLHPVHGAGYERSER